MRTREKPTIINRTDFCETSTHPAYGMISYSRITGQSKLVGSDIDHNHYMELRISTATKNRALNSDRFHEDSRIVSIKMSEQQWATFIASPNTSGVPCTLDMTPENILPLKFIPDLKEANKHSLIKEELSQKSSEVTKNLKESIKELKALIDPKAKLTKPLLRELVKGLENSIMEINSNMPFVTKVHEELMEHNLQSAIADVEGYITDKVYRLGLQELAKVSPSLIEEK